MLHSRPESALSDASGSAAHPAASTTFESLLSEVVDAAYRTALRLTRSPARAEELVHDATVLAFGRFPGLAPGTKFRNWYFQILVNCWRASQGPRLREAAAVDWDDTPELYLYARSIEHGLPHDGPDPADRLFERLGARRVGEAIDRLPDEYRLIAALDFTGGFTYEEIAWILDLPVGAARARLHRARKMLQKALWRVAIETGLAPGGAP